MSKFIGVYPREEKDMVFINIDKIYTVRGLRRGAIITLGTGGLYYEVENSCDDIIKAIDEENEEVQG